MSVRVQVMSSKYIGCSVNGWGPKILKLGLETVDILEIGLGHTILWDAG